MRSVEVFRRREPSLIEGDLSLLDLYRSSLPRLTEYKLPPITEENARTIRAGWEEGLASSITIRLNFTDSLAQLAKEGVVKLWYTAIPGAAFIIGDGRGLVVEDSEGVTVIQNSIFRKASLKQRLKEMPRIRVLPENVDWLGEQILACREVLTSNLDGNQQLEKLWAEGYHPVDIFSKLADR